MRISSQMQIKQVPPIVKFFFFRIFPIMFIIGGTIISIFGLRSVVLAKASLEWPTAQGKIVSSSTKYHSGSTTGGRRSAGTYHAEIEYEFSVEGTSFSGTQVSYGDYGSSDKSHANHIVGRYPKGTDVTVYYMPENPEECLLEPGLDTAIWFISGLGLIFLISGVVMAIFLPKFLRKQKSAEE